MKDQKKALDDAIEAFKRYKSRVGPKMQRKLESTEKMRKAAIAESERIRSERKPKP